MSDDVHVPRALLALVLDDAERKLQLVYSYLACCEKDYQDILRQQSLIDDLRRAAGRGSSKAEFRVRS